MRPTIRVAIYLLVFCRADLSAQRTWRVDTSNGPGTDFTAIQPAIDAATAGDVILVLPGATHFYSGFSVSKGVTVMADLRGAVRFTSDITVRGLSAGGRLMLQSLVGYGNASLILEDNAGSIYLEKSHHGLTNGRMLIRRSNHVVMNEGGAPDLRIESSFVAINRGVSSVSFPQDPVLFVSSSVVVLGNSILLGSRASYDMGQCRVVVPPGEAIAGYDSLLILGAGTTVMGGRLNAGGGPCPPISLEANAIRGSNLRVLKDPAATLGLVSGSVTVLTQPQPTLDAIVGDSQAGRMDLDLWGAPNAAAVTVLSLPTAAQATPFGFQWIDLAGHVVADIATLDGTGRRRLSFTFPTLYPVGHPMVWQALLLDGNGVHWSTPSAIVRN